MKDKNPSNVIDKVTARIEPEIETDAFSPEEEKEIVRMVLQDAYSDKETMAKWKSDRAHDTRSYESAKPSILESLNKKAWQSDRNLGLCASICDTYQATLLATCYNPDTIHFKATEKNDVDNKNNLENFMRWAVGESEMNLYPQVDDFIHNRVAQGFSVFKVYWKIWYEWVDRRIPKGKVGEKPSGYEIKTEKMRFEKAVIENIADVEDFLIPNFGSNINDLNHCIEVLHLTGEDLLDYSERGIFTNLTEEKISKLNVSFFDWIQDSSRKEKYDQLGITSPQQVGHIDLRIFPVDVYEWYGLYTKNGKTERYRFHVEPNMKIFLAGKPLRKIMRNGKYPYVGGAFIRRPGQLRGKSMPRLIEGIVNAINNTYNQKSDLQYVTNIPFGFHNPDEGYDKQVFELEPGVSYPVSGEPSKAVYFPNLSRSTVWAEADIRLLIEFVERATGAASYFMSNNQGVSGTATRDKIINDKSETRFGLWVKRIIYDISTAIGMAAYLYQDNAPPNLGERVLGEDGKQIFNNLSPETIRYSGEAGMSPDLISGSKSMEKQIGMYVLETLQQSPWFNPAINPKGSWNMFVDQCKAIGISQIESYMPPEPPMALGMSEELDNEWQRFMHGERFDPSPTDNPIEHWQGHLMQKQEKYNELDPEYRKNFDDHLLKSFVNAQEYIVKMQQEQIATQMAMKMIAENKARGMVPQASPPPPGGINVEPAKVG